jgi:hypothetical protein
MDVEGVIPLEVTMPINARSEPALLLFGVVESPPKPSYVEIRLIHRQDVGLPEGRDHRGPTAEASGQRQVQARAQPGELLTHHAFEFLGLCQHARTCVFLGSPFLPVPEVLETLLPEAVILIAPEKNVMQGRSLVAGSADLTPALLKPVEKPAQQRDSYAVLVQIKGFLRYFGEQPGGPDTAGSSRMPQFWTCGQVLKSR